MHSEVSDSLRLIGSSIKAARLRRRRPASDLAMRMNVSLPTLRKLEKGDPTVSLGTFAQALWVMGLLAPVRDAVLPENDRMAASMEAARLPKRVRKAHGEVNPDAL